jgi:hypothetical protein
LWPAREGRCSRRPSGSFLTGSGSSDASPPTAACPAGFGFGLGLLLAYLAIPIDLVPDFIPVVGYADDSIIVGRD